MPNIFNTRRFVLELAIGYLQRSSAYGLIYIILMCIYRNTRFVSDLRTLP